MPYPFIQSDWNRHGEDLNSFHTDKCSATRKYLSYNPHLNTQLLILVTTTDLNSQWLYTLQIVSSYLIFKRILRRAIAIYSSSNYSPLGITHLHLWHFKFSFSVGISCLDTLFFNSPLVFQWWFWFWEKLQEAKYR